MTEKEAQILNFIDSLRKTDIYIEQIFLYGGCYQFHLLLDKLYPGGEPYISNNPIASHVVTKYEETLFDITGALQESVDYRRMTEEDIEVAKDWSFHRNNAFRLPDCPHCQEPIEYKPLEKAPIPPIPK